METRIRRGNVPPETSSLVGRRRELDELATLIGRSPLVTITGVAGVGKTRLAIRTAGRLRDSFADGAWVVELSDQRNGDLIGHDIAAVLGLREQSVRPQWEVLADFLADKRLMLVLDTCDHLIDACATLLRRVLSDAPHARVLVTSRQPLGLPGERIFPIEPLPVPEAGGAGTEAVRLFTERAHALVPGLDLDPEAVAQLCRVLDGIPLAIELAARRLRALSPRQLAERLDDRFALLVGGSRTPFGRHQTMRTAVGWSHELCTAKERLLWARLSVFAGWFDADDARAVCADEWLTGFALPRLADKSILIAEGSRYRMLGTISDYGREWLRRLGEEETFVRRHRDHYLAQARRAEAEWYGPRQPRWAAWAHRELPNLEAILDHDEGFEPVTALWFVWCCLGRAEQGRHYLERALERHPEPSPGRTKALWVCAWAALDAGDTAAAGERADEAYAAAMADGDLAAAGCARRCAAAVALAGGDLDEAERLATEAVELFERAIHSHIGLPVAEVTLAAVLDAKGEPGRAEEVLARQWGRCTERGEQWARSHGDQARSLTELGRGEFDTAEEYARAALDVKWRLGDVTGSATVVDRLAAVVAARGDGRRAAGLLGVAQRMRTASERSRGGLGRERLRPEAARPPGPSVPEVIRPPGPPVPEVIRPPGPPVPEAVRPPESPGPEAVRPTRPAPRPPRSGPYGLAFSRERTETEARALIGDLCYDRAFSRGLIMDSHVAVAWIRDA